MSESFDIAETQKTAPVRILKSCFNLLGNGNALHGSIDIDVDATD